MDQLHIGNEHQDPDWLYCTHTVDFKMVCPWESMDLNKGDKVGLAVHNPSRFDVNQITIPVPKKKFRVYQGLDRDHVHYSSEVYCFSDDNCELTADVMIHPG
jgi:hypothetical protein